MSVIQKIRDKYARWAAFAIALAIIGFLLMDAFAGRTGLFSDSGPGNTLGKVNGEKIDRIQFEKDKELLIAQYRQQGYEINEEQRDQLMASLWDQKVMDIIMEEQYEELGLTVTDKEIRNEFITNPPQQFRQKYTDEKGNFNTLQAQQEINTILKDEKQREGIKNYLLQKKYMVLFSNTVNYPKWFIEKKNQDASLMAKVSYVNIPFSTIDDKAVKVTDEEIQQYINDHKDAFEQKEETRTISYVLFSAAPTSGDSAAIRAEVEKIKEKFAADTNAAAFVASQQGQYSDIYMGSNDIQSVAKDTILKQPVGTVYGPYIERDNYMLAKVVATKSMPDSVKCRHILIGTMNPQTGAQTTPDSVAKVKADSIAAAIRGGASFDLLDSLFSTDEVAKKDKGVMTFSAAQIQSQGFAKEFGDFILNGKPGENGVVKTQFGYHYIEIMEHKNVSPHYKIAFVGKHIEASKETGDNALNKATLFAGDSRDSKSFDENYEKKLKSEGFLKSTATVTPLESHIQGLAGNARSFVRSVYEAKNGDVLAPINIGDQYIVAAVTSVNKPGLQSVAQVRSSVEPFLLNKKKGEQIVKNIGQITTLEQVSAKVGQPIQTVDSIRLENARALGYEPRVIGAAFNPSNKNKVVPSAIVGTNGVYVVRVDNLTTTPIEGGSIEDQQKMMEAQYKSQLNPQYGGGSPVINALKRDANIKDNRHKFY